MTNPETPRPRDQHPGQPGGDPLTGVGDMPPGPALADAPTTGTSRPGPAGAGHSGYHSGSTHSGSGTEVAKEQGKHVAQDAKEQGKEVAQDAKEQGKQVAQTAEEEARHVAATVNEQARSLFSQASSEVSSQAGTQQQRLAEGLRSLSEEFGSMAEGSTDSGSQATGLVREAADRTRGVADWLEQREPGDVLHEVKRFARRKPGTFIAIAAGVGLLAGRMTRGLSDEGDQASSGSRVGTGGHPGSAAGVARPATTPYAAPAAGVGVSTGVGPPVAAPPVGAGPVDPGPMSGIGAGPVGGSGRPDVSGSGPATPRDLDAEEPPVYGEDPR